jgi:predicted Zn-dependent peptidase
MASRLFQEVREKRGLCYSIDAYHWAYADVGLFGLYAGTDVADVRTLMRVVVDEIATAAATLDEAEVVRAKAQMKVGLLMALESSGARAEQIARQIIAYGRVLSHDEILARIDAVTVDSARAAGLALLARCRPAIAIVGPGPGLESAAAIVEAIGRAA